MILIGIGSNLAAPGYPSAAATAEAALGALQRSGVRVVARSPWYESEPVPRSDQPWFVNGVARVATEGSPEDLLDAMLTIESRFARVRTERNAARTLDLDLLDFEGRQQATPRLILPHPRLHERRFVLVPLCEIAPDWQHPALHKSAAALLADLAPGQAIRRIGE